MRIEQTSKAHRDVKMKYLLKPVQCFHCTLSDCRPCFIHEALFMWLWLRLQRRGRSPLTNRQLIILTSLPLLLSLWCTLRVRAVCTEVTREQFVVIWRFLYFDLFIHLHQFFRVFFLSPKHYSDVIHFINVLIWNVIGISVLLLQALWKIISSRHMLLNNYATE